MESTKVFSPAGGISQSLVLHAGIFQSFDYGPQTWERDNSQSYAGQPRRRRPEISSYVMNCRFGARSGTLCKRRFKTRRDGVLVAD